MMLSQGFAHKSGLDLKFKAPLEAVSFDVNKIFHKGTAYTLLTSRESIEGGGS